MPGCTGYAYVQGNPVNWADPSGLYFWYWRGNGIEDIEREIASGGNVSLTVQVISGAINSRFIHAEYPVDVKAGKKLGFVDPSLKLIGDNVSPADLLNSTSGEIWEIKPVRDRTVGQQQVQVRIGLMNVLGAAGQLRGTDPLGFDYDWSGTLWQPGTTWFLSKPVFLGFDTQDEYSFYAVQDVPGVITWWKALNSKKRRVPEVPIVRIPLPEKMRNSKRNLLPHPQEAIWPRKGGLPIPQKSLPGLAYEESDGSLLIGGGVLLCAGAATLIAPELLPYIIAAAAAIQRGVPQPQY